MKPAEAHPSAAELQAFMMGTLADVSGGNVEAHLESCLICQERAAQAPPDRLVGLLREVHNRAAATFDTPAAMPSSDTAVWQPIAPLDANAPAELANHPRYQLLRPLGAGGMGTVWLAEHKVMGRKVALKLIRPEHLSKPGATERFRREVHAAARLQHPNIVAAHDAEQAGATHFLAMEYVEGVSLAEHLGRNGALPVAEACRLTRDVALGLQHAHELGLVHRDVKPHNLMLTRARESQAEPVIKILDFGLAALAAGPECATGLTGANMVMGTPDYIAPEQAEDPRAADVRADVYALGCTLYQMLTGRVPFPGGSALRKLDAHRGREPEPIRSLRPEVDAGLAGVLAKMMAKSPAARYQTPAQVAAALQPYTNPAPATPPRKPRRLLVAAAAVALLVGVVLAAAVVYRIQADNGEIVLTGQPGPLKVPANEGQAEPGKVELIRRIPVSAVADLFYDTAISPGGQYALVTSDIAPGVRLDVFNVATGEEIFDCPGYAAQFLNDEQIVVDAEMMFRVYQARTGKLVREGRHQDFWGMFVAAGGKHLIYNGPKGAYLYDLVHMKELHAWEGNFGGSYALFSPNGKRVLVRLQDQLWTGWDVENNCPAKDCGGLEGVTQVYFFFPDGKTAAVTRNGELVRLEMDTGKLVGPLQDLATPGALQGMYSRDGRCYVVRFQDGRFLQYRTPFGGQELGRYRLPLADHARPRAGGLLAISEDNRFATLVTPRTLYILKLVPVGS